MKDLEIDVRGRGVIAADPQARPVRDVSYEESPEQDRGRDRGRRRDRARARRRAGRRRHVARPDARDRPHEGNDAVTRVRLGRAGSLAATTASGVLYHWDIGNGAAQLTDTAKVSQAPLTAVEWALGGTTVIVGDESGGVSAWFRARLRPEADLRMVKAHDFESQKSAILAIGASTRERSFVATGRDGSVVLRHLTSERTLLRFPGRGNPADAGFMTPRADGIVVKRADGTVERYSVDNPHPEFSWRALLGKVWYEGYPQPEYVWQSTGGTEDFEPKMSLVPLVFGTIKATFYALVFAIPLAVMGALYTSQFVHPKVKAKVKPTVEIMAALPSVVIGFIAGLWLASRVEAQLVPALLLIVLLPLAGTAGVLFWDRLPYGLRRRLKPGTEVLVILPLLLRRRLARLPARPWVEKGVFGNDVKHWLSAALGLVYDQRNSVVVGLAMGFAVIPIIFTIAEDAFSSVPRQPHGGLPRGRREPLADGDAGRDPDGDPRASSRRVMVGFGRAVGETMIVLMATGNTPDPRLVAFNGSGRSRPTSPSSCRRRPYGGTLYRVLFVSASSSSR